MYWSYPEEHEFDYVPCGGRAWLKTTIILYLKSINFITWAMNLVHGKINYFCSAGDLIANECPAI